MGEIKNRYRILALIIITIINSVLLFDSEFRLLEALIILTGHILQIIVIMYYPFRKSRKLHLESS